MIFNVHGGHNSKSTGSSGYLNEVTEDRKVKDYLISILRAEGHTVYDCTDDAGRFKYTNLANIVKKCNAHEVDLDIAIHLNAFKKTTKKMGVEVWNYDKRTKAVSDKICANIAAALDIPNRGTKYNKLYYVLKNTKAKAMIVECCFVDSAGDAAQWVAKECAKAIAKALLGKEISDVPLNPSKPTLPSTIPAVLHSAYTKRKWYDWIRNYNLINTNGYSGVKGRPMQGFRAYTQGDVENAGRLWYRAGALGGDYFEGRYDLEKDSVGDRFAGDLKTEIDRLQIKLVGLLGYEAEYQVYAAGKWWPWVRGCNNKNTDGFAGVVGYPIECVRIRIVKI